jgi:hypothetical protein
MKRFVLAVLGCLISLGVSAQTTALEQEFLKTPLPVSVTNR